MYYSVQMQLPGKFNLQVTPPASHRLNSNQMPDTSENRHQRKRVTLDFSLTPGFSEVNNDREQRNRLNGFPRAPKPFKRFRHCAITITGLKPGVNERACRSSTNYAE